MFVLGNLLKAIAIILGGLLELYWWVILIAVLISWVSPDPYNPIVRILRSVTEPLLAWVRRRIPFAVIGMIDLSPIVVLLLIRLIQLGVLPSIHQLGVRLQ